MDGAKIRLIGTSLFSAVRQGNNFKYAGYPS